MGKIQTRLYQCPSNSEELLARLNTFFHHGRHQWPLKQWRSMLVNGRSEIVIEHSYHWQSMGFQ